jgi:Rrf2 family protein
MIQVSKRVEYALRAVVHLGGLAEGAVVSFKDIARDEQVPKDFLAKIMRSLVDAGILRSVRGAGGGFSLARRPAAITFLDVLQAADGPVAINDCCEAGAGCPQIGECRMQNVWVRAERAMVQVLRTTTIADVLRHPARAQSLACPAEEWLMPAASLFAMVK